MSRVWCACDGGLVINPDGAINQLEGGIIQGISWALKEGVRLDTDGIILARLGALSGHQVQRGAGNLLRAGQSAVRQPAARHRRGDRRPDRRGDRQRRRAGPRHPAPRPADDPRAGHGGAVAGVSGAGCSQSMVEQCRASFGPWLNLQQICSEQVIDRVQKILNSLKFNQEFTSLDNFPPRRRH